MTRLLPIFLALLFSVPAAGQEAYPSRPVKFVVPFPPGGPLDVPARLIAQRLTEHWGRPVVVENQAGASGSIGANAVSRAAPDGYTLLVTVDIPLTMYPAVATRLPYDPQSDFRPIGSYARFQNGLFVNPGVGVETARDLVELAKKQPGKLTFSSAGIASPAHFGGELFKSIAGIDMTHVPYKGSAPALQDMLAGRVDLFFDAPITSGPHVRAGKLRALAMASPRRAPQFPDVPTMAEVGFAGIELDFWFALYAPSATPQAVVTRLNSEFVKAMQSPDVSKRFGDLGLDVTTSTPAELAKRAADDTVRLGKVVRDSGAKAD